MSHFLRLERKPRPPTAAHDQAEQFPFSLPAIRSLVELSFEAPVTFFVGENGSGKSTLLEAVAIAAELVALGEADLGRDITLAPQRALASTLRLIWAPRSRRGFFLRAEDFFGFLKHQGRTDARLVRECREASTGIRPSAPSEGEHVDERAAAHFIAKYDSRSHGESFLDHFERRIEPGGLYLLDEPEAPLSPTRQMRFLSMLHRYTQQGAQFVIATHSPILLACPDARIYDFDRTPIAETDYDSLEHVKVTRHVLEDPERAMEAVHAGDWDVPEE